MQQPDYDTVHHKRFSLSAQWLKSFITPGCRVLELGGRSTFTKTLEDQGAVVVTTEFDLRKPWPDDFTEREFDIVLCMEVIEHISDPDNGSTPTEWQGSGVANMLTEARDRLKGAGILFLTTPNAASITAIHHAMRLAPPMIYRPHIREYAPYELDALVRHHGFEITRRETLDVWLNAISQDNYRRIAAFLRSMGDGFPAQLRGEDIFLLAKPNPES